MLSAGTPACARATAARTNHHPISQRRVSSTLLAPAMAIAAASAARVMGSATAMWPVIHPVQPAPTVRTDSTAWMGPTAGTIVSVVVSDSLHLQVWGQQ